MDEHLLIKALAQAEEMIACLPFEVGCVFSLDGELLEVSVGDEHSVSLTDTLASNSVITHNHPSGSPFSLADLQGVILFDAAEIRAVGGDYIYSLKRGEGGWSLNLLMILTIIVEDMVRETAPHEAWEKLGKQLPNHIVYNRVRRA